VDDVHTKTNAGIADQAGILRSLDRAADKDYFVV
jgi:hypothetical protein